MKKLLLPLVLLLLLIAGCATVPPGNPLENQEGYPQDVADNYNTPRTEENPVRTLRIQLDPSSHEHTQVTGRITGTLLNILTEDGDLLSVPLSRVHPEDRP